jgi:hypothetical protein
MSHRLELAGFELVVHSREFPDAADYWDGNWLIVTCSCRASGSFVEANGSFVRIDELQHLQKCLEVLHSGIQEKCEMNCMEPELSLRFEIGKRGNINFQVRLTPDNIKQSHSISFDIDQSYLPSAIKQCKAILENYPIRDGQVELSSD